MLAGDGAARPVHLRTPTFVQIAVPVPICSIYGVMEIDNTIGCSFHNRASDWIHSAVDDSYPRQGLIGPDWIL